MLILPPIFGGVDVARFIGTATEGRLLARDPDDTSRLHGNAPSDPVSRPAPEIPVFGRRAAGALASPEFLLVAACFRK
jgi:hypothetical protein